MLYLDPRKLVTACKIRLHAHVWPGRRSWRFNAYGSTHVLYRFASSLTFPLWSHKFQICIWFTRCRPNKSISSQTTFSLESQPAGHGPDLKPRGFDVVLLFTRCVVSKGQWMQVLNLAAGDVAAGSTSPAGAAGLDAG